MAFWFWVVILSIVGLGMYEVYSRYKEKNNPLAVEESVAEEETAVQVHAELTRANMKIAMLESRLQESDAQLEEGTIALTALEERYQEQLEKTERAYQRQMVNLSERIVANGNGWGGTKQSPEKEYPVRMAAEVAAWRATLGGQPLMDPAVSKDLVALAENNEDNIEAQNPALDTSSEETADPNNGSLPPIPEEKDLVPEALEETGANLDEASLAVGDLADEVVIADYAPEAEQVVLDQVVVLDESSDEGLVDPLVDEDELEIIIEAVAVREIEPEMETEAVDYETPGETIAAVEEIPPLENRWPDLESVAMQRVMARQLGSEMDADYLDDEEFLREMGIEGEAPLLESSDSGAEEMRSWITDPLEEMAHHLNGSERKTEEAPPRDLLTSSDPDRQTQKITDHMWEEVIFSSVAQQETTADRQSEPTLEGAAVEGVEMAGSESTELDHDDDEAAIAAAVASILSRAPGLNDAELAGEPFGQEESGSSSSDNDRQAFTVEEDLVEEDLSAGTPLISPLEEETAVFNSTADFSEQASQEFDGQVGAEEGALEAQPEIEVEPQEDVFVWERQPVSWQAEYFDNTKLSDAPVLVRQDSEIDFEWFDSAPAEGLDPRIFSVRWSGYLPLDPGQYRFTACAPDGLRLWLNDRLVISAWYDQSEQTYQRDFAWPGGSIDVRVEHYENGGNAKAYLTWDRIA